MLYVSLCIEELGMNIAKYGFSKKNPSAEINLSIIKDELILRFRDNGKAFDLTKWINIFHSDDPATHIGIRMLTGLAKEVTYTNSLNTNNMFIQL